MSLDDLIDLGGIGGENILEDVFAGAEGVANVMLTMFGGTAEIFIPGKKGEYNTHTGEIESESPDSSYKLACCDDSDALKNGKVTKVGGVLYESGDAVVLVPSHQVIREINVGVDYLKWGGQTYKIISTAITNVGDVGVCVQILGRK